MLRYLCDKNDTIPLAISLSLFPSFFLFLFFVREISFLSRSINPIRNVLQFIRTVREKKRHGALLSTSFREIQIRKIRYEMERSVASRSKGGKKNVVGRGTKSRFEMVRETEREREKSGFYHRSKVHISVRRIANRKILPLSSLHA